MPECEKLERCPFFHDKLAGMPAVADLMKQQFCLTDKSDCARYLLSSAGYPVPCDLFPNDKERALSVLKRGK